MSAQEPRKGSRAPRAHPNPTRTAAVLALLLLTIALSACAPGASWIRDQLDSGDAILAYTSTGARFDPLDAPAYQVHLAIRGEELHLPLEQPAAGLHNECSTSADRKRIDCSLGTVREPIEITIRGKGWIGSATYTRSPTEGTDWRWAYTPTE